MNTKIVYSGFALFTLLFGFMLYTQIGIINRLSSPEGAMRSHNSDLITRLLTRNEGVRRVVYIGPQGHKTIGIGHLVKQGETFSEPLQDAEINALLSIDLKTAETQAKGIFGDLWGELNEARQAVVIDMLFNLGPEGFLEFHNTIANIRKKDFDSAAREILASLAARENPVRYHRNAKVMRTGQSRYFEL